ncbi:MAG: hypothetical protein ACJAZV_001537, partial [Roseivirga sp.]
NKQGKGVGQPTPEAKRYLGWGNSITVFR